MRTYRKGRRGGHHTRHIGFRGLDTKVTREYEKKGYSKAKAELYGRETAAKVYHEQQRKKRRGF
jgi:hypothetical protein